MNVLTEKSFTKDVEPIIRRVFVGNEYTEPFVSGIKDRLLLYFPLGGDIRKNVEREIQLFKAIEQAAKSIDNPGCYLAAAWGFPKPATNENYYAYIPILEFEEAFVKAFDTGGVWQRLNIAENLGFCLCSDNSDWGLLKTIDEHAFLGGSLEFMQAVRSYFPDVEKEVLDYLHYIRMEQMYEGEINTNWLEQVLSHVYGAITAKQMIMSFGLI